MPFWANVFVLMKNLKTPLNLHHKEYENIIIKKLNIFQSLLCGDTQFVRRVGTKNTLKGDLQTRAGLL